MNTSTCKLCSSPVVLLEDHLYDDRYGFPGLYSVYQCTNCHFGQISPEPDQATLEKIYTDHYHRSNTSAEEVKRQAQYTGSWKQRMQRAWIGTTHDAHFYITPGTKVLDMGCGNGKSLLEIQNMGGEAYGTEYDKNIKSIAKDLGLNIHFGDLNSAPWSDEFFDFITMSQLLEHIIDPVAFLKIVKQKLKKNGRVVMSFPNIDSFNRKQAGRKWINWHIPYHVNFFSRKSILLLAEQTGLSVEVVRTITPLPWLQYQWQNNQFDIKEGEKSPFFTKTPGTPRSKYYSYKVQLWNCFGGALAPYTKIQDALHKGDSWLVILKKDSLNIT